MNIIHIKPSFPNEKAKSRKQKEIEALLYQVFSKYFEKKPC